MAKISVYVPDELLERAKAYNETPNMSQLVQNGLSLLVGSQDRPPSYQDVPIESATRHLELHEHFLAQAREEYRSGYSVAQDAAALMPLHVLDALVRSGFDVEKWVTPYRRGAEHEITQQVFDKDRDPSKEPVKLDAGWSWLWKSAEALGSLASPIDYDEFSFHPTVARKRGFADALKEIWNELENEVGQKECVDG